MVSKLRPNKDGSVYIEDTTDFIDEKGYMEWFKIAITTEPHNVALVGETGCGKDTMLNHVVRDEGWRLYPISNFSDTTYYQLVAQPEPRAKDGGTEIHYKAGPVVTSLRYANDHPKEIVLLYFAEFNWAMQGVTVILNPLTDDNERLPVMELDEVIVRPSNHYIAISQNPADKIGYGGANMSNRAQMRRFKIIPMTYMRWRTELKILEMLCPEAHWRETLEKMVRVAQVTRNQYAEGTLMDMINTGHLKNAAKMMKAGLEPDMAFRSIVAQFPSEQQPLVMRLWTGSGELNVED